MDWLWLELPVEKWRAVLDAVELLEDECEREDIKHFLENALKSAQDAVILKVSMSEYACELICKALHAAGTIEARQILEEIAQQR